MNSELDAPDTLCDHCENQPECDRHYLMCVDFAPKCGLVVEEDAPRRRNEVDE